MFNFFDRVLTTLFIFAYASVSYGQDTKVVVIPLFDDFFVVPVEDNDIEDCQVTSQCIDGVATVSCPSGAVTIPCNFQKLVFITSTVHSGNLGGLDGADSICQDRAAAASLTGTYKAWISNSVSISPITTFSQSQTPYALVNGSLVAHNWNDLIDGNIENSINIDEFGNAQTDTFVWTNTDELGELDIIGHSFSCIDWTDDTDNILPNLQGTFGSANNTDSQWTSLDRASCQETHHLYCFQQ